MTPIRIARMSTQMITTVPAMIASVLMTFPLSTSGQNAMLINNTDSKHLLLKFLKLRQ